MTESTPAQELVPVIDLATFIDGTDLVTAPAQILEAATTSGFFQITGHGIAPAYFDACYDVAAELMSLPTEVKETLRSPSGHPYRGLMSNYDRSGKLVSEGYTVARFNGEDDARALGVPEQFIDFFHENVWPPVDSFKSAMGDLSSQTRDLGRQLMRAFAVALRMPIDHFDTALVLDTTTSTIRSYPPHHGVLEHEDTVIFDSHFDGGTLTMLHQRGTYEGLQIRTQEGEWFSVPVNDEAFVINIGELMHRWTNGNWPATRHRVVASENPDDYRFTLPTFFNASVETVVEPLPTQYGEEGPAFEPTTVYAWFRRHITSSYQEREHTTAAASTEAFVKSLASNQA